MRNLKLVSVLLLCSCASCTDVSHKSTAAAGRPTSVALVIQTPDGKMPSTRQVGLIQSALAENIAKAGYVYAQDARAASLLLHIRFSPDPSDPQGGDITIAGLERNSAS